MKIGLGQSTVIWDYVEVSKFVININNFVSVLKNKKEDGNFYDRNIVVTIKEVIRR